VKPEEFRAVVLQAAIQGKLVPQDPNDEPASILLERIREEKQKLVKEGKIKKDKNDSFIFKRDNHYYENLNGKETCIDGEIPFEIPETWSFVRLRRLGIIGGGKTPNTSTDRYWGGHTCWISSKEVKSKNITSTEHHLTDEGAKMMTIFPKGCVVFVVRSGILRRTFPIAIMCVEATVNQDLKVLTPYDMTMTQWIYYSVMSQESHILNSCSKDGTTVESIDPDKLFDLLIPIPAVIEMNVIVQRIEEYMEIIYQQENFIKTTAMFKEQINQIALINAIQGKLTKQHPEEKPVEINCKNPIIRRDNSYYEIIHDVEKSIDDEIPFEIPKNWIWSRFGNVIQLISGRDLDPSQYSNDGIGTPYITGASNIEKDGLIINRWTRKPVTIAKKGDILISCKGTIGKIQLIKENGDMHIARQIMAVRLSEKYIDMEYALIFLESQVQCIKEKSKGTIPGISREDILNHICPIPPIAEQKRIASKMKVLSALTNQLSD